MIELKPCPFCGGKAKFRYLMPYNFVQCTKCKMPGPVIVDSYEQRDGKEQAIRLWNKKAIFVEEAEAIEAWTRRVDDGKEESDSGGV